MSSPSDDEEIAPDADAIDLESTLNEEIVTLDETEFHLPAVDTLPTLESILGEEDPSQCQSDTKSETGSLSSLGGEPRPATHLRCTPLAGISAQLQSAAERVSAGVPTALTAGAYIVVGTSHGLCLVFETHEAMRLCLGDVTIGRQLGAVSCLHLSPDGSRLIVGYARGYVQVYDLIRGKLETSVTDAIPPGTAILHARFTDLPDVALVGDSGGSVFELRMRRSLVRRSAAARCLFSGSRGEVVTFEPLSGVDHPDHPLQPQMLLAMATMSKIIVVSVRPQLRVVFTHALEAPPEHVPLLDWQFLVIKVGDGVSLVDPVLTFARRNTVHFYQVCSPLDRAKFVPLQWVEFPFSLQGLRWMNPRALALMDTQERLHLWDVRCQQQLETMDLSHMKIVYSTSYFKGLATGGNVSKAMAVAGEKACYESVSATAGQLMLLGTRGVHVLTLRSWLERLEGHVRAGEFAAALRLAATMYGEQSRPLAGLNTSSGRRRAIIRERMLALIDEWLEHCITSPGSEELLKQAVPTCAQHLLDLNQSELLFGRIHMMLESSDAGTVALLEWLQPQIVSGRLTAPPPLVMQQLVTHYEKLEKFQELESVLVCAQLSSLDIHQVMPLCWRCGLYDAVFRIYTEGMEEYAAPLLEMLARLRRFLDAGAPLTDSEAQLGNKLLVYISCCLAGRGYPNGIVPPHLVHKVKLTVISTLTSVHSQDADDSEPPYPHLRTLLQFDTREFLNVLSLSFEEDVFASELGMRQRQRIVDILLQLIVGNHLYSTAQVGSLFTFIARQMALPSSTVAVSRQLFEQVVDHLTVPGDTAHHEERQQALSALITAGVLEHYDTERLAQLAENAKFYRICELVYERRGEYDRKTGSMLRHPAGRASLHRYIRQRSAAELRATQTPVSPRDAASIALNRIQDLVDIDVAATADLFTSCLSRHLEAAVKRLGGLVSPEKQYQFLDHALQHSGGAVPEPVSHLFLQLMCQLKPELVPEFLSTQEMYEHDDYLQVCRSAGNKEGEAYLLERDGQLKPALRVLTDGLDSDETPVAPAAAVRRLEAAVRLCQRLEGHLPDDERKLCWFSVLDTAVGVQRIAETSAEIAGLVPRVTSAMIGHVPLPDVMRRILLEPAYAGGRLGPLRPLITDLLRTCQYQRVLCEGARRIVQADTRDGHALKRHVLSRACAAPSRCHVCRRRPSLRAGHMLAFRCGHFCHPECCVSTASAPDDDGSGDREPGEPPVCPVCPSPLTPDDYHHHEPLPEAAAAAGVGADGDG